MIRKFKNGNIRMNISQELKNGYYDDSNLENFYHDEMFMKNLCIESLDSGIYIIDTSTEEVYPFNYNIITNAFDTLMEVISSGETMLLYPLKGKERKEIIKEYNKIILY